MRSALSWLLVLTLTLVMIAPVSVFAEETDRKAEVIGFEGDVSILKAGGEKSFEPEIGMVLSQGWQIITGKDSELVLTMEDDKEVKVGEKTYITLEELTVDEEGNEKTGIRLWIGDVWSNIKEKLDIGESYEIRTPNTIMGAKGTKFIASYESDEDSEDEGGGSGTGGTSQLTVLEGVVGTKSQKQSDGQEFERDVVKGETLKAGQGEAPTVEESDYGSLSSFVLEILIEDILENPEAYDEEVSIDELRQVLEEVEVQEGLEDAAALEALLDLEEEQVIVYDSEDLSNTSVGGSGSSGSSGGGGGSAADVAVTGITTDEATVYKKLGVPFDINYSIAPSNATNTSVSWSLSDGSLARVDGAGLITPLTVGETTITVTSDDGGYSDRTDAIILDETSSEPIRKVAFSDTDTDGDVDTVTIEFEKPILNIINKSDVFVHDELGAFSYDEAKYNINSNTITWQVNDCCHYGTGDLSDLTVPGSAFTFTDYTWKSTDSTVVMVDEAAPVVDAYTSGYHSSYNNSDALKLKFSESVTFDYTTDVEPFLSANGSIDGHEYYAPNHHGLVLSGFIEGDRILINGTTKDNAGLGVQKVYFKLMDDSGKLIWVEEAYDSVNPTTNITFDITESIVNLYVLDSQTLNVTFNPDDAADQRLTWSTTSSAAVTVSDVGEIQAVGVGTATVTALSETTGHTDSVTVIVTDIGANLENGRDEGDILAGRESGAMSFTHFNHTAYLWEKLRYVSLRNLSAFSSINRWQQFY